MSKPKPLSEAHIQATCDDFLILDGWRVFKTDLPHLRGLGVQEPGMPDRQYARYLGVPCRGIGCSGKQCGGQFNAPAQILWVEYKRRGGKAGAHQKAWHARERALGALTLIAGESDSFPASIEGFEEWYRQSGLQRKKITMGAVGPTTQPAPRIPNR